MVYGVPYSMILPHDLLQSGIETRFSRLQILRLDQIPVVLDAFMNKKKTVTHKSKHLFKKLSGFQVPAVTETQICVKESMHHNGRSLCFSFFMFILDYQANLMFLLVCNNLKFVESRLK